MRWLTNFEKYISDLTFDKKLNKTQSKFLHFAFVVFGLFYGSFKDVFRKHAIVIHHAVVKMLQTVVKVGFKISDKIIFLNFEFFALK